MLSAVTLALGFTVTLAGGGLGPGGWTEQHGWTLEVLSQAVGRECISALN